MLALALRHYIYQVGNGTGIALPADTVGPVASSNPTGGALLVSCCGPEQQPAGHRPANDRLWILAGKNGSRCDLFAEH